MMIEMTNIVERISALEVEAQHAKDAAVDAKEQAHRVELHFIRIENKLDEIDRELSRYRGIVGGVLFLGTALITFFKVSWDSITSWLK